MSLNVKKILDLAYANIENKSESEWDDFVSSRAFKNVLDKHFKNNGMNINWTATPNFPSNDSHWASYSKKCTKDIDIELKELYDLYKNNFRLYTVSLSKNHKDDDNTYWIRFAIDLHPEQKQIIEQQNKNFKMNMEQW